MTGLMPKYSHADALSQIARRERNLLLIATAFLIVGTLTLATSDPKLATRSSQLAICSFIISFAAAHIFLNRYLPRRDPLLLPVTALLTGWGFLLIGRLAINFLARQAIWLLISTVAFLTIVWLSRDLRWLRRFRYTWLLGGLALLAATLVFGVDVCAAVDKKFDHLMVALPSSHMQRRAVLQVVAPRLLFAFFGL